MQSLPKWMTKMSVKILFVFYIYCCWKKIFHKRGKEMSDDLLLCKNLNYINTIKKFPPPKNKKVLKNSNFI